MVLRYVVEKLHGFIFFIVSNKIIEMSFWHSAQKEREITLMKQRYMHNILQYNRQQIEDKARRKQMESKSFMEQTYQINQESINQLIAESKRNQRKKEEEKNMLREAYDRQIREKSERLKYQKEKDVIYAYRQRERLDYQEDRRMLEISKIFNRVTYQATPSKSHRRVKTQGNEQPEPTPERNNQLNQQSPVKNLNNIEIKLLPPQNSNQNLPSRAIQGDSLDDLNYSFHKKESLKKY